MDEFNIGEYKYYPYKHSESNAEVVSISVVEPPLRNSGIPPFKKYKLVPILMAFTSPECELPPVEVQLHESDTYKYKVKNGYHRFYASLAVGYTMLPVIVTEAYEP